MIRTIKQILPPLRLVIPAAFMYAVFIGFDLFLRHYLGLGSDERPNINPIRTFFACGASFAYGVYRVVAFFPPINPGYYEWLRSTPWTSRQPLPLGPMHLFWPDVIIPGLLILAEWNNPDASVLLIPIFMFLGYLLPISALLFLTEEFAIAYTMLFGYGILLRLDHRLEALCIVFFALCVIALFGLQRMLARYPWSPRISGRFTSHFTPRGPSGTPGRQPTPSISLRKGWPCALVGPQKTGTFPLRHALAISVIAAWWVYAIGTIEPVEDDIDGRILVVVIILGFPFVRFVSYVFGHLPPAGIRARIRTRRLIIPGYDQVLLVPLIGAVAGVALLLAANYLWGLPSWSAGLIIGAALFYNLTARPSFAEWHLTGHHRLATWASTAPRHSFDASFDNPGDYQPHRSPEAVSS